MLSSIAFPSKKNSISKREMHKTGIMTRLISKIAKRCHMLFSSERTRKSKNLEIGKKRTDHLKKKYIEELLPLISGKTLGSKILNKPQKET